MSITMAKKLSTKKASAPAKSVAPEVDPLDASVASTTPVAPSKGAKKGKSATKSAVVAPAVPVAEPVATVASDNTVQPAEDGEQVSGHELVSGAMSEFSTNLQTLTTQLSNLRNEFKNLTKAVAREMKLASKASRRKRTGGNKQPSGFVKPTLITDELATFLGREKGTEMARTEVTKEINQYIRDNNLQDSKNGRHINPDSKLSKLLSYSGSETLTYFNLQKYLSPHFVKTEQPSA